MTVQVDQRLSETDYDDLIAECDHRMNKFAQGALLHDPGTDQNEYSAMSVAANYAIVAAGYRTMKGVYYPPAEVQP